jgi:hypothetical protein
MCESAPGVGSIRGTVCAVRRRSSFCAIRAVRSCFMARMRRVCSDTFMVGLEVVVRPLLSSVAVGLLIVSDLWYAGCRGCGGCARVVAGALYISAWLSSLSLVVSV